jgi:hypothetical protein
VSTAIGILRWSADEPAGEEASRLRSIRLLALAHLFAELVLSSLRWSSLRISAPGLLAACAAVAVGLSLFRRTERVAAPLGTLIVGFAIVRWFPNVANHTFLLFLALCTLSFWDLRAGAERTLGLATLRWIAALVLFATGLQKLLHGTYFHGEFLAFHVAHGERFASLFGWVLPAEEMERLKALGAAAGALPPAEGLRAFETLPPAPGSGPYRFASVPALALANFVWIFELVAPALLVFRRTRPVAVTAVIAFLAGVESGAYEIMFGVLFVNLILLFSRANWVGRLFPGFAALYGYLIGVHLGWFPKWFFN